MRVCTPRPYYTLLVRRVGSRAARPVARARLRNAGSKNTLAREAWHDAHVAVAGPVRVPCGTGAGRRSPDTIIGYHGRQLSSRVPRLRCIANLTLRLPRGWYGSYDRPRSPARPPSRAKTAHATCLAHNAYARNAAPTSLCTPSRAPNSKAPERSCRNYNDCKASGYRLKLPSKPTKPPILNNCTQQRERATESEGDRPNCAQPSPGGSDMGGCRSCTRAVSRQVCRGGHGCPLPRWQVPRGAQGSMASLRSWSTNSKRT